MTTEPATVRAPSRDHLADRVAALDLQVRHLAEAAGITWPDIPSRTERPAALFVGEPGRGKTSLINALLGGTLLPEGERGLPAYAMVRHGPPAVLIHQLGLADPIELKIAELDHWSEAVNRQGMSWVEILSDQPILESLDLIDTPASAAGDIGDAAATVRALGDADLLVFVADGRSALTEPELRYLERVSAASVATVLVLTRRDLYPEWRQIAEDNRELLQRFGSNPASVRIRAVSARLSRQAAQIKNGRQTAASEQSADRSGIPELRAELIALANGEVQRLRLVREVQTADDVLETLVEIDKGGIIEPDDEARDRAASEAEAQLEQLQRMADDTSDLVTDEFTRIELGLRRSMMLRIQDLSRDWLTRVAAMSISELDSFPAELEIEIAKLFGHLQQELRIELAAAVTRLERALGIAGIDATSDAHLSVVGRHVATMRRGEGEKPDLDRADQILQAAGVIVGAGGPMVVANLVADFLGLGIASIIAPYALIVGFALGGLRLFHQRRSKNLATARQQAADAIRDALENLRNELPPTLTLQLLDVHRVVESEVRRLVVQRADLMRRQMDESHRHDLDDRAARERATEDARRRIRSLKRRHRVAADLLAELDVVGRT